MQSPLHMVPILSLKTNGSSKCRVGSRLYSSPRNLLYGKFLQVLPSFTWLWLILSRQFVAGYENKLHNDLVTPANEDDVWMCHAQITQSSDYASYNVFYIVLILVIGGLVILGSYIIPPTTNSSPWESLSYLQVVEKATSLWRPQRGYTQTFEGQV